MTARHPLSGLTELPDGTLADLNTLTLVDLPPDHPIRQENARLTVRLALAEGRVQQALERLEREAQRSWRRDRVGQLLEGLGCILTGRSSSWSPEGGWPLS